MTATPQTSKRALRRAALERQKQRARRIYPHDPAARLANHLAACSCWMCGNQRRHFDTPTLQERKARESARFHLHDADLR